MVHHPGYDRALPHLRDNSGDFRIEDEALVVEAALVDDIVLFHDRRRDSEAAVSRGHWEGWTTVTVWSRLNLKVLKAPAKRELSCSAEIEHFSHKTPWSS